MKRRFARTILTISLMAAVPAPLLAVPPTPPQQSPLAGPNKAVRDAQAAVEAARKQLLVVRKKVEDSFAAKPDFKAAKEAMEKAKAEYDAEVRKIAASLEKDPAYVALQKKRDKAQGVIDESHAPPKPSTSGEDPVKLSDDDINNAVKDHQDAVLAMRAMQQQSEASDPNLAALKQKRQEAQTTWEGLQSQVDDALKADPAYPQAQQAVEQAEAQLKNARDALAAAAKAQRDAAAQASKARASNPGR